MDSTRMVHTRCFFELTVVVALLHFGVSVALAQDPDALTATPGLDQSLTSPTQPTPLPQGPGGSVLNMAVGPGAALGICAIDDDPDPANHTLVVVDLFGGLANLYDLDLNLLGTLASPGGANVHTGVGFIPIGPASGAQALIWVDITAQVFWETDLGGAVQGAFPLVSPGGGTIGGFTYDEGNDTFWANDIVADTYFEFLGDLSGPTGRTCPNSGAFGNGVAYVKDTAPSRLDILSGSLGAGQITDARRIEDTCGQVCSYSVVAVPDPFLNGLEHHPTGSTGVDVNYIVGNATNVIFEVETNCTSCPYGTVTGLICDPDQIFGTVTLSWTVNAAYDSIAVTRDGVSIPGSPFGPATTSVVDSPPPDAYVYQVSTDLGGVVCDAVQCPVVLFPPCDRVAPNSGAAPLGITIIEELDTIVVVSLFDGVAATYDRDLLPLGAISNPGGTNTQSGIAWWDPASGGNGDLYWVDVTAQLLWQTDTAGNIVSQFPLANPGLGLLAGLTVSPPSAPGDFTANDIVTNAYYPIDADGTAPTTIPTFVHLDMAAAFGNGVTDLQATSAGGQSVFDGFAVPTGPVAGGMVDRIEAVTASGVPVGCSLPVGSGTSPIADTFVNGNEISATGPAGCAFPVHYVVGNATNQIYATRYECDPCLPVEMLLCEETSGVVTLSWSNPVAYVSHVIERNGLVIDTVAGGDTTYQDPDSPGGQFTVRSLCATGAESVASCTILIIDPMACDLIWDAESGGNVDSMAALASTLVSLGYSLTVTPDIEDPELVPLIGSQFTRIWVILGTFPHNHVMSAGEGTLLAQFLLGGTALEPRALYVEGGDHFLDPPTDLAELDHVVALAGGASPCYIPEVVGLDTGLGLDLTPLSGPYVCDGGGLIDHLGLDPDGDGIPDPSGGGAEIAAVRDGGPGNQVLIVAGDGNLSGLGNFTTVASSAEFGGIDPADQIVTLEQYVGFLTGCVDLPLTLRGDVNADGSFVGLVDGLFLLSFGLVPGSPTPPCLMQTDVDGDGILDTLEDALALLNAQFVSGAPPPPPPFPDCGFDRSGFLLFGCDQEPPCP